MTLIVYVSDAGREIALQLMQEIPHAHLLPYKAFTAENFRRSQSIIFIGAMGVCVRCIAPHIQDKHTDPAVLCVDSMGRHVVSVISGHIGGANKLTRRVARILGADPVITTQSDNEGLWSLDTLAPHFGWQEEHHGGRMNELVSHYVNGRPTTLRLDIRGDRGVDYLRRTCAPFVHQLAQGEEAPQDSLQIRVSPYLDDKPEGTGGLAREVIYRPPVLHIGVGCAHACQVGTLPRQIVRLLRENNLSERSVGTIDTIPLKAEEPLLLALKETFPWARLVVHQPDDLRDIPVPNPSEFAMKHVGIPSVSEAAAMTYGPLLIEKTKLSTGKGPNVPPTCTVAVSMTRSSQLGGHIEIVGAGPGDPGLISVQGMQMLQQADLILYAGSLVPERLTHYAHVGCTVRSSASMTLDEQFRLMREYYDRGQLVVRLHTGDPCIYGAIQEQMALFDEHGMRYHITPGISAFQAAAAALQSQFTIPERVQTIILTRGEGRTPMPEREQLHLLAQSQSTMCIYLSAAIAQEVQDELLQCYPPETPVAACYKLTWPEQKIYRGQLRDLARIVRDNNLTLTTLLVVGEAIDNRKGTSRLYADDFQHQFRK